VRERDCVRHGKGFEREREEERKRGRVRPVELEAFHLVFFNLLPLSPFTAHTHKPNPNEKSDTLRYPQ
jgi:hypothetical protein